MTIADAKAVAEIMRGSCVAVAKDCLWQKKLSTNSAFITSADEWHKKDSRDKS
jgi:hypothetical protein